MGQYWQLVSLDSRETLGPCGKLGDFLFDRSPGMVVRNLLNRRYKPLPITIEQRSWSAASEANRTNMLPVDLIQELFDAIDNIPDTACLAVTCKYLWFIGKARLHKLVWKCGVGNWAGDRIICVGDESNVGDYPKGMLTEGEDQELQCGIPAEQTQVLEYYVEPLKPISLYELSSVRFQPGDNLPEPIWSYKAIRMRMSRREYSIFKKYVRSIYSRKTSWALRNLSKHEYVHSSALATINAKLSHSFDHDDLGFGEVILSRICWSTSASISMINVGDIHRGVWAGDRFDIVPIEDLGYGQGSEVTWKDVSDEVVKNLTEIFFVEYEQVYRARR